jgi:hypothetical protein
VIDLNINESGKREILNELKRTHENTILRFVMTYKLNIKLFERKLFLNMEEFVFVVVKDRLNFLLWITLIMTAMNIARKMVRNFINGLRIMDFQKITFKYCA